MRMLLKAVLVWFALIAMFATLGGFASLYTGKTSELPKWNGISYLLFSIKEFAVVGTVLTCPIPVIVFWKSFRRTKFQKLPKQ